jgi:hypothetical protein
MRSFGDCQRQAWAVSLWINSAGCFAKTAAAMIGRPLPTLRRMLIRVYVLAADTRRRARAAQGQIDLAKRALASLKAALRALGEVRPKRQRGVIGSFGSPLDDIKGTEELNEFGSSCWQLQFDLESIAKALDHLIAAEIKKPRSSKRGGTKKTLTYFGRGTCQMVEFSNQKIDLSLCAGKKA